MTWEWAVTKMAENWSVILGSLPLFLILAGLVAWVAFRLGQADNAKELRVQKSLRELADKESDISKAAVKVLEEKAAKASPGGTTNDASSEVVAVVTAKPSLRFALDELVSTRGLHFPIDPRGNSALYVSVSQQELERMAAARYFIDRGMVGQIKPEGSGVTFSGSLAAVHVSQLVKAPDEKG